MMELNDEVLLENRYRAMLAGLPPGGLTANQKNGRYYYKRLYRGCYEYIGSEATEMVRNLKLRKFLEVSISTIEKNKKLIKALCDGFLSPDPETIVPSLPLAYRPEGGENFENPYFVDYRGWEYSPYVKDERFENLLTFSTVKGDLVRSEPEALIANLLYEKGISYHYREQIETCSTVFHPTFCVAVKSDSCFRLLEHCGCISSPGCINAFLLKIEKYMKSGFVPFKDVFFTFEDEDGNVDMKDVNLLIETHFR